MLKNILYDAISEHIQCKECLRNAIISGVCNPPSLMSRDEMMCKFGKWLHSEDLSESVITSDHLKNLQEIHKDFHKTAADIMELIENGELDRAQKIILEDGGVYSFHTNQLRGEILNWVRLIPD